MRVFHILMCLGRVWRQIHGGNRVSRAWWGGQNHYKNPNVICTKKAFISLVLHIVRWHLWHKTTPILHHNIHTKRNLRNKQNNSRTVAIDPAKNWCCRTDRRQIIIIIISQPQSTARHRPLQCLAISLDLRLLASISSRPAQIVTPPGLRASYTTFT
jgi:hypothetical protein